MIEVLETGFAWAKDQANAADSSSLGLPTPCADWTVRQLLNHSTASTSVLARVLAGEVVDAALFDSSAMAETHAGDDPGAAFGAAAERLLAAARVPGALEGICHMPMGDMPGMVVANVALLDAVVHAWDVAKALGRPPVIPPTIAEAVLGFATQMVGEEQRGIMFDPVIPTDAHANETARLVAFLGRKP